MSGIRIAHLINPVKVNEDRDLHFQQPFTFDSMEYAREFAEDYGMEIDHYACFYPEDEEIIPDGFRKLPVLEQSTEGKFNIDRKLPYFKEMIDKLYEASDADYFIQTNADIGLMPHFYHLVMDMIENVESFCINKRIVPENIRKSGLPAIWSSIGLSHAGCDCFVFPRKLYPKFDMGEICMGTPWSETVLITNLVAYSKNFIVFKNAHATFHLGDRRIWLGHEYNDYRIHNTNEFARVLIEYKRAKKKLRRKVFNHETIVHQLAKLKMEVHNYSQTGEVYSKDCWDLIS